MRIIKRISLLVLSSILVFAPIGITNASFSARTEVNDVSFSTGEWEGEGGGDSDKEQTENSGEEDKVKINEVYYQGGSDDEWVELYNAGNSEVDIQNWSLEDNTSSDVITENSFVLSPGEFVVVVEENNDNLPIDGGSILILSEPSYASIGNGLADNDELVLLDADSEPADAVSWGTNTDQLNPSIDGASDNNSIARKTATEDTDSKDDWEENDDPNPGTNPHSHINVNIDKEGQELEIGFDNAHGFNKVKYAVYYDHEYQEEMVDSVIEGSEEKDLDQEELSLEPIYLGTCSSLGEVCTPHTDISNLRVSLMYKKDVEIIGTINKELGDSD